MLQLVNICVTLVIMLLKEITNTGEKVFLVINGTGACTPMEMSIVFRKCALLAEEMGVKVVQGIIDELLTVQEMAGFQMILCVVDDEQIKALNAKSDAPYWTSIGM